MVRKKPYTRKYITVWAIYWTALLVFLLIHTKTILGEPDEGRLLRTDGFVLLLMAILGSILLTVLVLRPRRRYDEKGKQMLFPMRPWHLFLMGGNTLFCFWIVEYVNNEHFTEMKPFYVAVNLVGIFIIHLILLCWLNSVTRAMLAALCIWAPISIAFYLVYTFRGEPLQIIDFTSLKTAFTITDNYSMEMQRSFVVDIVLWACLLGIYMHLPRYIPARTLKKKILLRLGIFAAMIGGYFFYLNTPWNAFLHIKTNLFSPIKTYEKYGTTVGFFCVGKYMRLVPPEGYSVKQTRKIAEQAAENTEDYRTTDIKPENIIAIMNESWCDYSYAGDLKTNIDPMPFYHSLTENTIKGYNMVCITGGGTAKTEYEFLTGNSVKRFPAMVPYVSYFTHDQYSLSSTLKDQGYTAIAMHPYKGSNWKRPTAYQLLGFEHFYTVDDFDDSYERLRSFVSDKANYQKIIEMTEEKEEGEPLFLFDVTMQNHGGYKNPTFTGEVITEEYEPEETEDKDAVDRFLSLEKASDDALKYLIEHYETVEEPTLIIMFGDHYPTLPDSFTENLSGKPYDELAFPEQQRYYSTPFLIWANYDIPEKEGVLTSTNYLGTLMMNQTGLEQPEYNIYLNDLMKTIPALNHQGFVTPDGENIRWEDAQEPYSTKEWEYECLQYNNLSKKRERLDWFFTVGE
ncbi:MAG: sulfatase-like hydrolase/transferase [Eubacterium sp.]|nr:sulfatase-like hydrolase/transferase [Eubacterium sp.]